MQDGVAGLGQRLAGPGPAAILCPPPPNCSASFDTSARPRPEAHLRPAVRLLDEHQGDLHALDAPRVVDQVFGVAGHGSGRRVVGQIDLGERDLPAGPRPAAAPAPRPISRNRASDAAS